MHSKDQLADLCLVLRSLSELQGRVTRIIENAVAALDEPAKTPVELRPNTDPNDENVLALRWAASMEAAQQAEPILGVQKPKAVPGPQKPKEDDTRAASPGSNHDWNPPIPPPDEFFKQLATEQRRAAAAKATSGGHTTDPERDERILNMFADKANPMSVAAIAKAVGCGAASVHRTVERARKAKDPRAAPRDPVVPKRGPKPLSATPKPVAAPKPAAPVTITAKTAVPITASVKNSPPENGHRAVPRYDDELDTAPRVDTSHSAGGNGELATVDMLAFRVTGPKGRVNASPGMCRVVRELATGSIIDLDILARKGGYLDAHMAAKNIDLFDDHLKRIGLRIERVSPKDMKLVRAG